MINYTIAIYGCGNDAEMFSDYFMRMHLGKIQNYVQTIKSQEKFRGIEVIGVDDLDWESYDFIIIASSKYASEIKNTIENICPEIYKRKVIYMLDFVNETKNANDNYAVCTVEGGLHFIFNSADKIIGPWMWLSGKTDGADVMDYLFEFANKRGMLNKKGIFLDIGANIGTASVYAKFKEPDMDVIAFEPGRENYKVLQTNCVLNDMRSIRAENIGLGSVQKKVNYVYRMENPGASRAVQDPVENSEIITINTLDNYIAENGIDVTKISFIWMDIEGSECDAIIGGMKTLMSHRIPMIHEFNYERYERDEFKQYIEIMSECFEFFIDVREAIYGNDKVYNISELQEYADKLNRQTDLFFF